MEGLVDTIQWRRQGTNLVQDESTGSEGFEFEDVFRTPAKVQMGALASLIPTARERIEGGGELTMVRSIVKIPIDENRVEPNMIGEVVAIGDYSDPMLLGKKLRIVAPIGATATTTRRFSVEEVL